MEEKTDRNERLVSSRFEGKDDTFDTIAFRLDPTPTLIRLKAYFLKANYNPETAEWKQTDQEPMFLENGINDLFGELYNILSVDVALSYLSENKIKEIVRDVGEKVHEFIWFNHEEYKIQEKDWNRIYLTITNKIEIFLYRAKDGNTDLGIIKQFEHKEIVTRTGSQNTNDGPKKSGVLSLFGGR